MVELAEPERASHGERAASAKLGRGCEQKIGGFALVVQRRRDFIRFEHRHFTSWTWSRELTSSPRIASGEEGELSRGTDAVERKAVTACGLLDLGVILHCRRCLGETLASAQKDRP